MNENRKKGQFNAETAVKANRKSLEAKVVYKSLNEDLKERCTPDRVARMNDRIIAMAEHGNLKAYELIRDGLGEKPQDKVEIRGQISNPLAGLTEDELRKLASESPGGECE